jgi:hypothetical protein
MPEIRPEVLSKYLSRLYEKRVKLVTVTGLGEEAEPEKALKEYSHGTPMRIDHNVGCERRHQVFNTVRSGGFGHDTMPACTPRSSSTAGKTLRGSLRR